MLVRCNTQRKHFAEMNEPLLSTYGNALGSSDVPKWTIRSEWTNLLGERIDPNPKNRNFRLFWISCKRFPAKLSAPWDREFCKVTIYFLANRSVLGMFCNLSIFKLVSRKWNYFFNSMQRHFGSKYVICYKYIINTPLLGVHAYWLQTNINELILHW